MTSNDIWPSWKTIGIIYSPRVTNVLSLKFKQLLLLEILWIQGFWTLTTGDLKWPLTSMKNNRDHLLTKGYQHAKFEVQATLISWEYHVYKVFILWPLVTSNDLWPPWKINEVIYSPSATYIPSLKFKQHLLLEISCLQGFGKVTSNDLWPPWKTIGIIYSPRATNVLSLKFKQLLLLEISQGFHTLTSGDLKWPLTSMKNNRDHLLTKAYQRQVWSSSNRVISWDIMFTKFSDFDHLKWSLTSVKNK